MNNPPQAVKHQPAIAQRNGQILFCPKCRVPLVVGFERDIEVDHCQQCRGLWVERKNEKQLLNIKPEVFSVDELKQLPKLYKPLERVVQSGYVPCPICQQSMNRRNWGSHSGVIVDKCTEHGSWFDKGELEKVREYISLGGIEYEKLKLMEKGLAALDYKLIKETQRLDKKIASASRR